MKILIEQGTTVEDVKTIFTKYYPYLKIEFYKTLLNGKLSASKKEALPFNFALGKLLKNSDTALIDLSKDVSVAAVEIQFANAGLNAEVFRKSGNVWIETSLTDNWTLQQQNAEGEEISRHFTAKSILPKAS